MKTVVFSVLGLLFCSTVAWGQATVDEALETAFIYVDANTGSDSNPGTQQLPLKTIGAGTKMATSNNVKQIGSRVIINPGTYRESVAIGRGSKVTSLPITFEAATNGTVIMSGADVWTGWSTYSGNSQIFTNSWPYKWGLCPPDSSGLTQQDIVLRRELIAVNSVVLTQVLSLNEMMIGTFYVDETGGTVYVWPPAGTNMSTATVEVATRSGLFSDAGMGNLVFRGLTFQYDNSCRGKPAFDLFNSASNVLFDTDNFNWNNAQGLGLIGTTFTTVQNTVANHNGDTGLNATKAKDGLWQSDQASYNNWRGAQGAYYNWGTGGFHFYQDHDDTVTGLTALYNFAHGIHWDVDNADFTADSLLSSGNLDTPVQIEKSEGPITITNSSFCNSNPPVNSTVALGGVSVNNSEFITFSGDSFYNTGDQIDIGGEVGGYSITNWETGQVYDLYDQNMTLTQNTIEGVGSGQLVFRDNLGGLDWTTFQTTLVSDYNTWWNASNSNAFTFFGSTVNFAGWLTTMLTDVHSTWQAPLTDPSVACKVTPDKSDFWIAASTNSLTVLRGVPAVFTISMVPLKFTGTIQLSSDGVQNIAGATSSWSQSSITNSGTATFTVTAGSAATAGTYPIVLMANSGSTTHTITVSVFVDTSVSLTTYSLNFGNQQVSTTSPVQTVTLTNKGTTPLSISNISLTGYYQKDFSQTNTCPTSLGLNASCTINVSFSPLLAGTLTAALQITDADATSPQTVNLTGTGTEPVASVSPLSLTFTGQAVGTVSPAQIVTITNTGAAPLTFNSISAHGSFAETNTCGTTLAANASCTVNVTFAPTTSGTLTGTVNINDNANPGYATVNLTGTGTAPVATVSPLSLTFAGQVVNTTSPPQTITITNTGTASLTITSVTAYGTFAETNTCTAALGVDASCTVSVTFTPGWTGTRTGSIVISHNATPPSTTVSLTGTGIRAAVSQSPTSLTFSSQEINTSSPVKKVTLTNTGTAALSITNVSITGNYTQTNTCGSSVGVGKNCTFSITFTPTGTGTRSGTLTVTDNANPTTQKVTLTGTGSS